MERYNRPVSKRSFEETGRLKKVATAPLGASCPNDNSDFRNKSNVWSVAITDLLDSSPLAQNDGHSHKVSLFFQQEI